MYQSTIAEYYRPHIYRDEAPNITCYRDGVPNAKAHPIDAQFSLFLQHIFDRGFF
jgi:hypothetical protein